ncbi:hypothetical protein Dsin_007344 [Dipteronia sinensis]|uniref:Small auxin up regulated protein n=1 Tax=Dipteronia sinensis TaxID=43782 RepID=A0AAE0EH05_9ROSI|nr:hypothetical protein Dsin_007344 [Dipteronia sinensis]
MSTFFKKILRRSHSNSKHKHKNSYYEKLEVGKKNETNYKIPKGFMPIYVRKSKDEEFALIRYVIPISYLSCQSLHEFIKESQDDPYETIFDGPITLPCTPEVFEELLEACVNSLKQALLDRYDNIDSCN